MSKPWKPKRQTVELRPSRIRRDPVPLASVAEPKPESPEREVWTTVAGVVLFAAAVSALTLGISEITSRESKAAPAAGFDQCYNGGSDCVLDGDTIHLQGARVEIAGIDAPEIRGARCPAERDRGIDAAVRLAALLNSGKVTIAGTEREPDGQLRSKVEVDGHDAGAAMLSAGVARPYGGGRRGWCD